MIQDIRFGIRILLRQPAFTALAIVALALGIGATTAVFSVVNGVLLEPLPFNQPERVVALSERNSKLVKDTVGASFPNFKDWQEQNQVFESIAAFGGGPMNWTNGPEPVRVSRRAVSADFFNVLGMTAALGRTFHTEDETRRSKVAVLSNRFWQTSLGGDTSVIGASLTLDNSPYTVIGVMPAGFRFLSDSDLWTLLDFPAPLQRMRGAHFLQVVARLRSGVSVQGARKGMDALSQRMAGTNAENQGWSVDVVPLHERLVGPIKSVLLILMGAVSLVLLIACANVAGLLLARGVGRQQEIALRAALGAGRIRLIRQLLTESLLLSLFGGALGLLLASWGVRGLRAMNPPDLPRLEDIRINGAVLGFSVVVLLLTTAIFGLAPAWQSARISLQQALKQGSRASARRNRSLDFFVVGEIALSLVLLVGAGLLIRSFVRLMSVDPGFNAANVVSMQLSLPAYKYPEHNQQLDFYRQLLEGARALPDVESAGLVNTLPLTGDDSKNSFSIEGRETKDETWASLLTITPDYFRTMGISLRRGRAFTEQDDGRAAPVVIINEAMAHLYWPDEEAVGKRIRFGDEPVTVVGVIGDIKHASLEAGAAPETYIPAWQTPSAVMTLVVRLRSNASNAIPSLRAVVASLDKDQPIETIRTMEEWVSRSTAQRRSVMTLISLFAILALVLASIGIYGVIAHRVSRRTHEIGIRMALGAEAGNVMALVVGQGMRLMLIGVALGLIAAFALTRLIRSLLFAVDAADPATFAAIALLLMAVAIAACYVPARRATKVDPLIALKYE